MEVSGTAKATLTQAVRQALRGCEAPIPSGAWIPAMGFMRLNQILGDPSADPPIPPVMPISRASWWRGVKDGRYPQPVRIGERTTAWRVEDIRDLVARLSNPTPSPGEQRGQSDQGGA